MHSIISMTSNDKVSRYLRMRVPNLAPGLRRLDPNALSQLLSLSGCTHAQPLCLHVTSSHFSRTADRPLIRVNPQLSLLVCQAFLARNLPKQLATLHSKVSTPPCRAAKASILESPPVGQSGVSRTSANHAVCTSCLSTLAGLPATTTFGGTSRVTTLPDPMTLLSPMVMPGLMMAPPPIHTLFPILHENVDVIFLQNLHVFRHIQVRKLCPRQRCRSCK
jgi:hypothetical protein